LKLLKRKSICLEKIIEENNIISRKEGSLSDDSDSNESKV